MQNIIRSLFPGLIDPPVPIPTKKKLREIIQEGMKQAVMDHVPGKPLGHYQVEAVARALEAHYGVR